ncbi:hypothetical protein AWH56_005805 [Anaerobacillus isosaccharinicus]|nr:hypothetical protein [Anaerobacillus isosaccharinicus]
MTIFETADTIVKQYLHGEEGLFITTKRPSKQRIDFGVHLRHKGLSEVPYAFIEVYEKDGHFGGSYETKFLAKRNELRKLLFAIQKKIPLCTINFVERGIDLLSPSVRKKFKLDLKAFFQDVEKYYNNQISYKELILKYVAFFIYSTKPRYYQENLDLINQINNTLG